MSEYVYPGDCCECKYYHLDGDQFPCSDCKHNIPVSSPAYLTAPENYEPLHKETEVKDSVSHPSHYNQGNIECIDAMVAAFGKEAVATFCHINAFKYLWRTEHKNGLQDIDKAIWYLNKYKELKASGE